MTYAERVIDWLQENGCGTTAEISVGIDCPAEVLSEKLTRMRRAGILQATEYVSTKRNVIGRPKYVWGLSREKLEDLVSGKKMTRVERALAWLSSGNTGTALAIAAAARMSQRDAGAALKHLERCGLAVVVTKERPASGFGKSSFVWAWTGESQPAPPRGRHKKQPVDKEDDGLLPLDRTPPDVIVRSAISHRHPLELVWGAAA